MATFRMDDGTVVNTDNAVATWEEATFWDGRNHISKATGSQWNHQTLHKSRKGRYYLLCTSQWQGSRDHVEWVSPEEACRWLLANDCDDEDFPEDLKQYVEEIEE